MEQERKFKERKKEKKTMKDGTYRGEGENVKCKGKQHLCFFRFTLNTHNFLPIALYFAKIRGKFGHTICLRSSDQFYIESYFKKWVTTSWAYSIISVPQNMFSWTQRRRRMTRPPSISSPEPTGSPSTIK